MIHPIVHIGYSKTATKWFQHHFYPALQDIYFLNRQDVFSIIIKPDIFEFKPNEALQQINSLKGESRLAICEELLMGGLDIAFGNGEFIQLMASRLKLILPDAEIVIFIRNQRDILESSYNQYVKSGGTYSPSRYFGFKRRFKAFFKNYHLFNQKIFEYDRVIDLYKKTFGIEKVHVFLYEDFLDNPEEFISDYCKSLYLPHQEFPFDTYENRRFSTLSLRFMRFMNHFTYKNTPFKNNLIHLETLYYRTLSICEKIDRLNWFKNHPFHLSKNLLDKLGDYYKISNTKLNKEVGLDRLMKYKYPL